MWSMLLLILTLLACGPSDPPDQTSASTPPPNATLTTDTAVELGEEVYLVLTLDDEVLANYPVGIGGLDERYLTDENGGVWLPVSVPGLDDVVAFASHPDARTGFTPVNRNDLSIGLTRFSPTDNTDFVFGHPGTPDDRADTSRCAHCHTTLNDDWYASPHRTTASNPRVQDVYAGTASDLVTESACANAGGQWWMGLEPGTRAAASRCYLGGGTLPDLNVDCGESSSCDVIATATGACADCHAPGIDGETGGRDLLEATGSAYDFGVHCDVCHHVESIDLNAPAGVAGRLHLVRPSDLSNPPLSLPIPLTFGPFDDVPNPVMGAVQRDHFQDGSLCAGCHQLDQAVLVPGQTLDAERWPGETLPIHTTWAEWEEGSMSPNIGCPSCHMPPNPEAGNSADLFNVFNPASIGIASGWPRPPGAVRHHSWVGPRTPDSNMLALATTVSLTGRFEADTWVVNATVTNVGPGHAVPTGEPSRQLLLLVEADCLGTPLVGTGGDVVPDYGGALATKDSTQDWTLWPTALAGDEIRVLRQTGSFVDYNGAFGPFGDGTFSAAEKGIEELQLVGVRTILAVDAGTVTLNAPLPLGELAVLGTGGPLPTNGETSRPWSGAP
ncbi:MAG: hypothetical protein GWP91_14235, partial [Rhodobacterales bacterium]|nr:hypothetical protein [Rhodobacterales bacterium]